MSILNRLFDTNPTTTLSADDALDILANERRRHILRILDAREGALSTRALADRLADRLDIERKAAYVSVYQTHLPQLQEQGVVSVDAQARIHKTGAVEALCYALDAMQMVDGIGGGAR